MTKLWEKLRLQVLKILEAEDWHTMCVCGEVGNNEAPVILITAWNPRKETWLADKRLSAVSRVQDLCKSNNMPTKVVVAQAYDIFFTGESSGGKPDIGLECFTKVYPGASLALQDPDTTGAGSFGAYFVLKPASGPELNVGLTNYHVVRDNAFVRASEC